MEDNGQTGPELLEFYALSIGGIGARHIKEANYSGDLFHNKKAPSVRVGRQDREGHVLTILATEDDAVYLRKKGFILFPVIRG